MLTLRWKLIRLCVAVWLVATINYAQPGSVRANVLDDPELSGAIPSRGVARRWRFNDLTPAMLSQSGLTAFNPSDVVDGQVDDNAWHTDQSTAGAWLRVDLGAGNDRPFTEARVYARSSYNGVYDVEYSTNGSNWSVAYSGFQPTPAGWHAVQWTSVGPARYWRLRLTNTPGPGAWLSELEFNVAGSTTPPSSWDVSPYNYDNQRCADACTGVVYSHTTVPNFTMDIPRAVTLVYSSERALPKPLIALYVDTPSGGADEVWLQVNRSGSGLMTFVNGETTLKFKPHSSGSTVIGGRLNVSGLSTGMYDIEVIVTWVKAGTATTDPTWLTKLMVVDESNSPFGRGWMLAGWQRLYVQSDGSALITQGDGSAVYFKKSGSAFISPPGDFTTLKTTGYGWVRQYKDSTQVHFNTSGQTAAMVDPFGTQQLHFHYTNGRIDKITHPGSRYHYIDYGTYGISKVRTSLSPDRPTTYTVQSNGTLTQIKDPDNISTNLQYDGNLQLWKVTARNGGITTFEYDTTRGELTKRIDPSVAIYPSGSQSPTTILYPYTHRFVPDGSTAGAPKSTTSAGNEYGTIVPPGGNESDWQTLVFVRPDHFRASTHTIVPENHQTWTSYDDDGLPVRVKVNGYGFDSITAGWGIDSIQYTEHGVPDWIKSVVPSGTAREVRYHYQFKTVPDSLWGGGQPAIRRFIGANGRIDSIRVDGDVTTTSSFAYNSRGQLTQVKDAFDVVVLTYEYDPSTYNLVKETRPGGEVTEYGHDQYGRVTTLTPPDDPTQTTYYDIMNRVDSLSDGVNSKRTRFTYGTGYYEVKDAKDQVYRTDINLLGWVKGNKDPLGNWDLYQYDVSGQLKRWTNRRNQSRVIVGSCGLRI